MNFSIPSLFGKSLDRLILLSACASMLLISCSLGSIDKREAPEKAAGKSGKKISEQLDKMVISSDAAYSSLLEEMDRTELENIDHAIALFANNKADSLSRDSMLVTFNELMNDVMQSYYATKLTGNQKMIDQFENHDDPVEANKTIAALAAHGIQVSYRLGDFFLEPDLNYIAARLNGVLTTSSRSYLDTSIRLSKELVDDKNQPLSTPDSLALQVCTWEEFMVNHPEYVLKDVILAQYIDVLSAYLSGIESFPLFDPATKILDPSYQKSYLHYLEKYANTESGKTVRKFYDLLASKGFKYDESFDTFLSEVNFNPLQNSQ